MTYKHKILILISTLFTAYTAYSQTINWASLKAEQHRIATVYAGFDYGFTYGASYSFRLRPQVPLWLNGDFSAPAGEKMLDDFKIKMGGIIRLYTVGNFRFSTSLHGIYRRYENPSVRLQNFGSEVKGIFGYYKKRWFVAGEAGLDKAIVTQFKHSNLFRENFPEVKDGWYQPATGGNFSYGLQVGYSLQRSDVVLRFGSVINQDFRTKPTLPFYSQVSYNFKF